MSTVGPERWQAVSPYLDRALEMTDDQRAAWLASLEKQNPALAAELQTLLAEYRAVGQAGFLERGPIGVPGQLIVAGQTIGAYTLVAPIGHGGMGSVWLAERSDGRFDRRVALKFLNIAVGGGGEERFKREGRILARLTHPHVAQLVDAGVSSGGQPYLVLEYVDGKPIDRYCNDRALTVDTRIRLFLDVLAAVAHAHVNLIVHRDIKPSNVFVDVDGQVKLLDFGIAKLLEDEGEAGAATMLTREAGAALTPEYAAPEQVTGGAVTTATDVHALGVLLYVLLSGQHPVGAAVRSPADLMKAIAEREPRRMSEVAGQPALRRQLRGDLDTIVAKALKKDPHERYASVTTFADDLRRSLAQEPIGARRDTLAYRAGKFVRRNRLAAIATMLTVVSLSVALYFANHERVIAQRRFVEVRQLSSKLFDIDAQVRQLPGSSKTRQFIVDTSLEYLQRLAVDAGTDPELAVEVGTAYMRVARVQGVPISANLGQLDQADQTLQKAQALIESVVKSEPANRIAILRSAQIAHDRMILAGLKRPEDDAIKFAEKSAGRLEQYLGTGNVDPSEALQVVLVYQNVARRYIREDRIEEGIRMCRRTIEVARANNQPVHAGAALMVMAGALRARGDLDEALQAIREAARVIEPPPDDKTAGRAMNFAMALIDQGTILGLQDGISLGRSAEAIPLLERGIKIAEDFARQDPADSNSRLPLATGAIRLAGILCDSQPRRANEFYEYALHRLAEDKNNSRARRDEVRALAGVSYPLRALGRPVDAKARLDAAFERLTQLKLYPASQVNLGSEADDAVRALAEYEAGTGNLPRAIAIYERHLDQVMAANPKPEDNLDDAADLSRLYQSMAALEQRAGRAELASSFDARRLNLWQHWAAKLPNNPFVVRQLALLDKVEGAISPR